MDELFAKRLQYKGRILSAGKANFVEFVRNTRACSENLREPFIFTRTVTAPAKDGFVDKGVDGKAGLIDQSLKFRAAPLGRAVGNWLIAFWFFLFHVFFSYICMHRRDSSRRRLFRDLKGPPFIDGIAKGSANSLPLLTGSKGREVSFGAGCKAAYVLARWFIQLELWNALIGRD